MKSQRSKLLVPASVGAVVGILLLCMPILAAAWTPFVVNGRCKKTRGYCRSTVGNRGGAGACCDPAAADVQTCVADNECIGTYRYVWTGANLPLKWNFAVNKMAGTLGYDGITAKQMEDQLKRAFELWGKPACSNLKHKYLGQTPNGPDSRDGVVTIFLPTSSEWARLGASGALAFATPYSDNRGNIINADIYVNPTPSNTRWGVPPVASQNYDFFHTLLHEIGHALGLGHSYSSVNVMYFSALGSGPSFKGLSPDDTAGICSLYPAANDCKTNDECAPCHQCKAGKCTAPTYDEKVNCKACTTDAQCGSGALCVAAPEGSRCLLKCAGDCCPNGYQCRKLKGQNLCVPYTSHCPRLQCATAANCGANSVCNNNLCEAPPKYDYQQCSKSCAKDSECTSPYECVTYGTGKQRCTLPCPEFMCPLGFNCRLTQKGQHCIPNDEEYCSCRRNADCAQGRSCEEDNRSCTPGLGCDRRCISQGGSQVGEPCNFRNPASCALGLRCEKLAIGYRCIQECATKKCPPELTCIGGGVNLCMKEKSRDAGRSCDGLLLRCNDGLTCVNVNDAGTFCVETCDVKSACSLGGKCGLSQTPPFCECNKDADCTAGFGCTPLLGGASVCQCKNPPCQVPCGNGVCDSGSGENCTSCPKDCGCEAGFSCTENFCKPSTVCGNNICEVDKGENCTGCPKDCKCGFGSVCSAKKCVAPFCGDGVCDADRSEDCDRCPSDCGCKAPERCLTGKCTSDNCGDGKCDAAAGEHCGSCPADCKCPSGQACANDKCAPAGSCGDGTCDTAKGEDCVSCTKDCGCTDNKVCDKGACVSADTFCPKAQQELSCEAGGRNCKVTCKEGGCGCSQGPQSQLPAWLLLFFFLWLFRVVQRDRTTQG